MFIYCYLSKRDISVLYTNIDLKLLNKLHGPMHYKKGFRSVYNGHKIYILCCNNTTR